MYLLDRGARLGRAFSAFREAWFETDYMGWRWTPRPGAEAEIQRRVEDLALTLKAEDWLALPERVDRVLAVPLPAEARARYRRLERELVPELGEAQISAVNAGVLAGKLLQAANGALYAEDGAWHRLHDAKLDALEDLLEAAEGEPVLVAYAYRSDRERLLARFPQAVELRAPGAIDAWNRGEVPILLAHPASGGHGLNLQAGGRHVVWWGLTWSLELYQQLTARLHREGQTRPALARLTPRGLDPRAPVGRGAPALTAAEIAAAIGLVTRAGPDGLPLPDTPAQHLLLYLWGGHDTDRDRELLLLHLAGEATKWLPRGWKPATPGELRQLLEVAVAERRDPRVCRTCAGAREILEGGARETCPACGGLGWRPWGARVLARDFQSAPSLPQVYKEGGGATVF